MTSRNDTESDPGEAGDMKADEKSGDMAAADVANGERPEPADHKTGKRQAEENAELDPPA